jgi:ABC-2 type transport system permease protein
MLTLLVLAFLGGIFIPYSKLPHVMQQIANVLPSYHLVQLGWNAVAGRALGVEHMLALAAWGAALGLIAVWRWRQESTTA